MHVGLSVNHEYGLVPWKHQKCTLAKLSYTKRYFFHILSIAGYTVPPNLMHYVLVQTAQVEAFQFITVCMMSSCP